MKKHPFLIFLCLMIAHISPAQWTKLTTKTYTDFEPGDVHAYQGNITAVGYMFSNFQGVILKSTDDGKTWDTSMIQPGLLLKTVAFKDPDTGYIAGFGSKTLILRTTDGGAHWNYYYQDPDNAGINDMQFVSARIAVASGYGHTQFSSGQCYRTIDGGATWSSIAHANLGCLDTLPMDYIQFLDTRTGYGRADFLGGKEIMKTTDSGKSWSLVYTHNASPVGFHFWNVNNGILIDINSDVYKTTDGGQNWVPVSSNLPSSSAWLAMGFLNQTMGFIIGDGGVIYKTTNAGTTWTKQTSGTTSTLMRLRFWENRGYVIGRKGVVLRSDVLPNNVDEALPLNEQLNIYPNPASDVLIISSYNGAYRNIKATLTDINGRMLKRGATENGMQQLNTSDLPAGIYTLSLTVDGKRTSSTVSVVH